MKTEVTPGMFSQAEIAVSKKTPIVMAGFTAIVLVFFGILGTGDVVVWQFTKPDDTFALPDFTVASNTIGLIIGVVLAAITAYAFVLVSQKKHPALWLSLVFGLLAVIALLSWLAAGNKVQFAFILSNAIVLAIPIALGAMAGIMSERVGVVNIAIEGQLLTGAFLAAVVGSLTDNLWVGLLAAMVGAALLSMVLATFSIKFLVDQIIVGVVLNVLVLGVTNFLYSQWLANDGKNANFPGTFPIIEIPVLSEIPILGPALFENRITTYLAFLIIPALWFFLFKTKLGLRARAVGEHPLAADTVGINVARTRFWWVTIGGMVAGLGGAALTIGSVGAFGRDMSGGQGFIALAVVILGRWHPFSAGAAALLFGFAIILRIWANQVSPGIPTDFITMVPYVVTLIAVVGFVGRVRAPAADGQPYIKG
ncbi:nucleoside ABC transporter membrane protein [Microbacteriaceae bacterium MWH-Ta3]|nr:nucleoside ABC transporter membrane protein [Microbacteriaceae bacterium MWH-Ta3]